MKWLWIYFFLKVDKKKSGKSLLIYKISLPSCFLLLKLRFRPTHFRHLTPATNNRSPHIFMFLLQPVDAVGVPEHDATHLHHTLEETFFIKH